MNRIHLLLVVLGSLILLMAAGCNTNGSGPKALLSKYFTSAINQDYGTTYDCYYYPYKQKVDKDEYIKHRKEGPALKSYRIVSLEQKDDSAHAEVLLNFAPSGKLDEKPASSTVKEDMVKEGGEWKIKVW